MHAAIASRGNRVQTNAHLSRQGLLSYRIYAQQLKPGYSVMIKEARESELAGSEDVQTPREVYEALASQGYRVQYHRVPITDGSSPREAIFDQFYQAIWQTRRADPVIFNCQMGAGRTTTGMVIACLVRTKQFGGSFMDHSSVLRYGNAVVGG